jgi:hypothetical protein
MPARETAENGREEARRRSEFGVCRLSARRPPAGRLKVKTHKSPGRDAVVAPSSHCVRLSGARPCVLEKSLKECAQFKRAFHGAPSRCESSSRALRIVDLALRTLQNAPASRKQLLIRLPGQRRCRLEVAQEALPWSGQATNAAVARPLRTALNGSAHSGRSGVSVADALIAVRRAKKIDVARDLGTRTESAPASEDDAAMVAARAVAHAPRCALRAAALTRA